METKFQRGEGLETIHFLQDKLAAEIVYEGQELVHLKLGHEDAYSQATIGFTEEAKRIYPRLFSLDELFLLFEHPLINDAVRFVMYAPFWLQDAVSSRFGGFCDGKYWIVNNETKTYYGYKGNKLPEASEIVNFVEKFLHC